MAIAFDLETTDRAGAARVRILVQPVQVLIHACSRVVAPNVVGFYLVRVLGAARKHLLAEVVAHHRVEKRIQHAIQIGERVRNVLDGEQRLAPDRKAIREKFETHVEGVYGQPAHAE